MGGKDYLVVNEQEQESGVLCLNFGLKKTSCLTFGKSLNVVLLQLPFLQNRLIVIFLTG